MSACKVPPAGWACARAAGHEGPCAAVSVSKREHIAMIIDPISFSLAYVGNRVLLRGVGILRRRAARQDKALAKADAILALALAFPDPRDDGEK